MPLPSINPPLINSSNPWATTLEDLQELFDCPDSGGVTTRTSLLHGFQHDDEVHQYTFFDTRDPTKKPNRLDGHVPLEFGGSLNTLGYTPIPISTYLAMISKIISDSTLPADKKSSKSLIISVTGSAEAVRECYERIRAVQATIENPLCMEINLSCPNIPDKPPPAYSGSSLAEYLKVLTEASGDDRRVAIGIKTPPYTYHDQFKTLIDALVAASQPTCPIDFITATNTLGTTLVLADNDGTPRINSASGAGIGALGNVKTIRSMLDEHDQLKDIDIIGVGGVSDRGGFDRMRAVGAKVVGIGTALGREGVNVFGKILSTKLSPSGPSSSR
ncbi:dihydroorotate dehydrogenase [Recurvomyces mirabilis]|uniref:Dihydroorotate dehydrogenase (fumarate) n=1 Tax=Recurvomyces mirabilis TaxID=574656 RepID=A0AAE0TRS8_9PEZI|nr:dihydroorotate dehydrogenase [Recurvomyces mirabilis]KAK5160193.1 dihydroorotate dehydrogenase [Recurvomyces mirabilis]